MEIKKTKERDNEQIWNDCLSIFNGYYNQLNIKSLDELDKYFESIKDTKSDMPEDVKKANRLIFENVLEYNNTQNEECKLKAIDAQEKVMYDMATTLLEVDNNNLLFQRHNTKKSNYSKNKLKRKMAKKSRQINHKRRK